jgi:hypothetical protein
MRNNKDKTMKDNHEDLKNEMYNLGVQLRTLSCTLCFLNNIHT